jgi:hypothetical protein
MIGVVMGVWFCVTATGYRLVALLTNVIGTSTVKDGIVTVPDDGRRFHMIAVDQFYLYAFLMLCGAVVFIIIAKLMKIEPAAIESADEPAPDGDKA